MSWALMGFNILPIVSFVAKNKKIYKSYECQKSINKNSNFNIL